MLPEALRELFSVSSDVIIAPLMLKNEAGGIFLADNAFHQRPIPPETNRFPSPHHHADRLRPRQRARPPQVQENLSKVKQLNEKLHDMQRNW